MSLDEVKRLKAVVEALEARVELLEAAENTPTPYVADDVTGTPLKGNPLDFVTPIKPRLTGGDHIAKEGL